MAKLLITQKKTMLKTSEPRGNNFLQIIKTNPKVENIAPTLSLR